MENPGEISEQQLEATREQVEQEIEEYIRKSDLAVLEQKEVEFYRSIVEDDSLPQDTRERNQQALQEHADFIRMGYLGNFMSHIPGSVYRKRFINDFQRRGQYDKIFGEVLEEWGFKNNSEEGQFSYSRLHLSQTPRQFHQTVDSAIEAEAIPPDELKDLVEKGNQSVFICHARLYKRLFPAYIRLRAMGYTRQDLNA